MHLSSEHRLEGVMQEWMVTWRNGQKPSQQLSFHHLLFSARCQCSTCHVLRGRSHGIRFQMKPLDFHVGTLAVNACAGWERG